MSLLTMGFQRRCPLCRGGEQRSLIEETTMHTPHGSGTTVRRKRSTEGQRGRRQFASCHVYTLVGAVLVVPSMGNANPAPIGGPSLRSWGRRSTPCARNDSGNRRACF